PGSLHPIARPHAMCGRMTCRIGRAGLPIGRHVPDRGKIWILEDSPLEGEMARRALSLTQDVELFADGSVLLERATTSMPDVVVLDWHLPGVSGLEVCRMLRSSVDGVALPILMLTAQGNRGDVLEALSAGANDYVTKPYDISE